MSDGQYLAGRVTVRSLPLLSLPTAADAPVLKRLPLPQGELAHVHDGEEALRYLAVIELAADGVRGHHYHDSKRESVYVIEGALELLAEDIQTRERISVRLAPGDLLYIAPGVAHALRTVTPGWAVEFAPARLDPADSHRYRLD